jgi:hypothetical protein
LNMKMNVGILGQKWNTPRVNPTTFLYRLNFKEKTDLMGNFL